MLTKEKDIEMHPVKCMQHKERVLLFCLLSIIVYLSFNPILKIKYTVPDDTVADILAKKSFSDQVMFAYNIAVSQGRFNFILSVFSTFIPFLSNNPIYFNLIRFGIIGAWMIVGIVSLYRLFNGNSVWILFLVFFASFAQNTWDHNALTSFPFIFNMGFLFIFQGKRYYCFLSSVLFFLSSCSSELFVPYSIFFIVIWYSHFYYSDNIKLLSYSHFYSLIPVFAPLLIYCVCYVVWQMIHPSKYPGNQLSFDLWRSLRVIWQYSISGIPGYYFVTNTISGSSPLPSLPILGYQVYSLGALYASMRPEWIVKSVLVSTVVYYALYPQSFLIRKRVALISITMGILAFFLPNVLLSITPKYQEWVAIGSPSYIYTYFSFIAFVFVMSVFCVWMISLIKIQSLAKVVVILASIIFGFLSLTTDFHNYYISQDQDIFQNKWRIVDNFLSNPISSSYTEENTLLIAPALFDHRIAFNRESYWSEYVRLQYGKQINIIKDIPENLSDLYKKYTSIYMVDYQIEPWTNNCFLSIGKADTIDDIMAFSSKNWLFIFNSFHKEVNIGYMPSKTNSETPDNSTTLDPKNSIDAPFIISSETLQNGYIRTAFINSDTPLSIDKIILGYYQSRRLKTVATTSATTSPSFDIGNVSPDPWIGTVDLVNGQRTSKIFMIDHLYSVQLDGWLANIAAGESPEKAELFLMSGETTYYYPITFHNRPDVSSQFGNSKLMKCGYSVSINVSNLFPGEYNIGFNIFKNNKTFLCKLPITFMK